ncbi:MAG TPA: hypothetical protein PKD32_00020 [Saprospiraceae bacterium]|nr:hypothetical protein [Saprospiraceae bacterium]
MELIIKQLEKSISAEIGKKFTLDRDGISQWLLNKNLIGNNECVICFTDLKPWTRTGGETYSTVFEFETTERRRKIFVKAIVTQNPEKSLQDWTRRRNLLKKNNIPTSNWYWSGEATIFEEYYPHDNKLCDPLLLMEIGYQLDKLGFTTLKFIDDIRCDVNHQPYYVDFGFDLGEPSQHPQMSAFNHFVLKFPELSDELNKLYHIKGNY